MRLGVVGMLPGDLSHIGPDPLRAIRRLRLTGAAFHAPLDRLHELSAGRCRTVSEACAGEGVDLVQFGLGYSGCLFDPDQTARDRLLGQIEEGIAVSRRLGAHVCLIRTGSLSPRGAYSPSRRNLEPDSRHRLVDSLRRLARGAESEAVTMVIETHLLTIMDSPETCAAIVAETGSERVRLVLDYVNHFQTLSQVYDSGARLRRIFDLMGPLSAVGHCKDLRVGEGLVLHLEEAAPGQGELDLTTALRLWHDHRPDGYMLLEHLPDAQYPEASAHVHRLAAAAGIEIH
jgi:sugar phosphate isomerase/epimerase